MAAAKQVRRYLTILAHLQVHPGAHAEELATRCGVSARTIFRDLNALDRLDAGVRAAGGYQVQAQLFAPSQADGLAETVKGLLEQEVAVLRRTLPPRRFDALMKELTNELPQEIGEAIVRRLESRPRRRPKAVQAAVVGPERRRKTG
jgi:predicted DNA-binding transcriptional regulator YafY